MRKLSIDKSEIFRAMRAWESTPRWYMRERDRLVSQHGVDKFYAIYKKKLEIEYAKRAADWYKTWGHIADDVRREMIDVAKSIPSQLNPLPSSFVGAGIRRGEVYGAKVGRALGQASPKK